MLMENGIVRKWENRFLCLLLTGSISGLHLEQGSILWKLWAHYLLLVLEFARLTQVYIRPCFAAGIPFCIFQADRIRVQVEDPANPLPRETMFTRWNSWKRRATFRRNIRLDNARKGGGLFRLKCLVKCFQFWYFSLSLFLSHFYCLRFSHKRKKTMSNCRLKAFNLLRWNDVPRTSRIFQKSNTFSVLSIFKCNPGKTNNKFITSY